MAPRKRFGLLLILLLMLTMTVGASVYDATYDYAYQPSSDYLDNEWDIWWTTNSSYQVANFQLQYVGPSPAPNRNMLVEVTNLSMPNPNDPNRFYLTEIPLGSGDTVNYFRIEFVARISNSDKYFVNSGDTQPFQLRWNFSLNLRFRVIDPRAPGENREYYGSYFGRYRVTFYVKEPVPGSPTEYTLVEMVHYDMNMIAYYRESNYGTNPPGEFFTALILERFTVADSIPMPVGGVDVTIPVGSVIFMSDDTTPGHTYSYRIKPAIGTVFSFKENLAHAPDIPYGVFVPGRTTTDYDEFTLPVPSTAYQNAYWQDQIGLSVFIDNDHPNGIPFPAGNYSSTITVELVTNY